MAPKFLQALKKQFRKLKSENHKNITDETEEPKDGIVGTNNENGKFVLNLLVLYQHIPIINSSQL